MVPLARDLATGPPLTRQALAQGVIGDYKAQLIAEAPGCWAMRPPPAPRPLSCPAWVAGYRMKLDDAKVMADIEAAAAYLGAKKLGIVGYCFGGTVAWWGATRTTKFAASSCWYGGGIAGTKDERPHCPVQMHFGEKDASIPMSDVEAVRMAQPKAESYVYPGAGHGFGCDERGSFSKPDYELAQQRTLDFFARHLA